MSYEMKELQPIIIAEIDNAFDSRNSYQVY